MNKDFCILDCYVDEPACLGVPPFISPYPRYIYGALLDAGIEPDRIDYLVIDTLREREYHLPSIYSLVIIIGGAIVPGKYLGSKIGTVREITTIVDTNHKQIFAIGGLSSHFIDRITDRIIPVRGDIEKFAYHFIDGSIVDGTRSIPEIARWAISGASMVKRHPWFPDIICEMETYRGCPRQTHCSFCSEGLFQAVEFREVDHVIQETEALIAAGVSRFRIGRQADIIQYHSDLTIDRNGFPRPRIGALRQLFSFLKKRRDDGDITVLNVDNANPGTIVNFPDESASILELISNAITPGDTLALGIETFDPVVAERNNLKVTGEGALFAIDLVNRVGGERVEGIPKLLPGVNLLHGLPGESACTFEENFRWLIRVLEADLLLKRINIRTVLPFPGTAACQEKIPPNKKRELRYRYYRDRIRKEIEHAMLSRIYPVGSVIKKSQVLMVKDGYSYGKQIASYAITTRFPQALEMRNFYTAIVTGHRERSLAALTIPIRINNIDRKAMESIPGIGKARSAEIIMKRPFSHMSELDQLIPGVDGSFMKNISLS